MPGWLGIIVTLALSVITAIQILSYMKFRGERNSSDIANLIRKQEERDDKISTILVNIKVLMETHALTNKVLTDSLSSVLFKVEKLERQQIVNSEDIAILKDWKVRVE